MVVFMWFIGDTLISLFTTDTAVREICHGLIHFLVPMSGFLNIIHAFVGAVGIACGAGLAMILFRGEMYEMCLTPSVPAQLISCGIASMGFAWLFKAADKQAFYVGIGGSMTWGAYLIAQYLHEIGRAHV